MKKAADGRDRPSVSTRPTVNAPLLNATLTVALTLMVGWLLHVGQGLLTPIVAAILCVFIIGGLSAMLARLPNAERLPRWVWDAVAAIIICLVLVELVLLLIGSLGGLAAKAHLYQAALGNLWMEIADLLDVDHEQTVRNIQAEAARVLNLPSFLRAVAGSAVATLAVLVFILLNIAFLMLERHDFRHKINRIRLSEASRRRLWSIVADVNARVGQYLAVQTLLNIALGILSWAIMVTFGLEFAVVFALIIALLNSIPYFGSFIGVALPVAAALVQFEASFHVVWLAALLGGAQFLIGNIVAPRVMGQSLNLSPWVILIGLTFWTSFWGLWGAVFSVPIMAVAVVILSEFEATRPLAIMMSQKGDIARAEGTTPTTEPDERPAEL